MEGQEYALLTPVDTPVSLFKINEKDEHELIERIDKNEQILKNAEAVLQEHDLRLIRSAVTLTVSGELEEPIYDELEEDYIDDDSESYELLVNFNLLDQEYALLTPVDTPVSLFKINEKDEPELIEKIDKNEQILKNAEAVLQELSLIHI